MRPLDVLFLAGINLVRGASKNKGFLLIVVASLCALLASLMVYDNVAVLQSYTVTDVFDRDIAVMVTLPQVSEAEILESLLAVDHVQHAVPVIESVNGEVEGGRGLPGFACSMASGSPAHIPPVRRGSGLQGTDSVLLPHKLYVYEGDVLKIIYPDEWVGGTLILRVQDRDENWESYTLKITGLYHNNSNKPENTLYMSPEGLKEISGENARGDVFVVVADKAENVTAVITDISELRGFTALKISHQKPDFELDISLAFKLIYVIIALGVVSLFASCAMSIISKIANDKRWLALLKTMGYRNSLIFVLLFAELMIFLAAGFIISAGVTYLVTYPLLTRTSVIDTALGASSGGLAILYLLGGIVLVSFLASLVAMVYVRRISPAILMKD